MHESMAAAWWRPVQAQPAQATSRATGSGWDGVDQGSRVAFMALVAFTFILFLSPQAWFPPLRVLRIALVAAGVAAAAHAIERTVHRRPITPQSPEIALALLLVGWAVITLPLSMWPAGSLQLLTDNYLKAIAFFWLIGSLVTSRERLRVMAWTLVLCSMPLAATGVQNYLSGRVFETGVRGFYRIAGYGADAGSGIAANPNDLALVLNLVLPIAVALTISSRGLQRVVAFAAVVLGITGVIVTFSRAGFVTLAAIFVLSIAVLARRRAPGAAALLVAIAVCVPPLLPESYLDRLSTITDIEADQTGSAQGRWTDLKAAATLVARNPVVGAGIGQDILALNRERGEEWTSVHNAYLQHAVDLGIPGMLLFVALLFLCYRSARAVEKRAGTDPNLRDLTLLAAGIQVSLIAFAIEAMFHPIAYQFYFFCIGGLAVALRHAYRSAVSDGAPAGLARALPTMRRSAAC